MVRKIFTAAALLVPAATLAGVAIAGSSGKQQRIAIVWHHQESTFVLTPLTPGPIRRDSGTFSACCWTRHVRTRDGQSIEIDDPTYSFSSNRGTFTWHVRTTFVFLDNDYTAASSIWKVTSGTGSYAHLEGHGRMAFVARTHNDAILAKKAEGLFTL